MKEKRTKERGTMANIRIEWKEAAGKIKPMHAVNNGVAQGRMNNFEDYRKA